MVFVTVKVHLSGLYESLVRKHLTDKTSMLGSCFLIFTLCQRWESEEQIHLYLYLSVTLQLILNIGFRRLRTGRGHVIDTVNEN